MHRHVLRRLLSNPVYVGRIVRREGDYAGRHAAILTAEEFEATQRRLRRGVPRGTRGRASLAGGVAVCGACGSKVWITQGKARRYYFCGREHGRATRGRCPHRETHGVIWRCREDVFDARLLGGLKALSWEAMRAWVEDRHAEWRQAHAERVAKLEAMNDRLEGLRKQRRELMALRIRSEIGEREFQQMKGE